MSFVNRKINRLVYPTKHVLVVEDYISNQKIIASHFNEVFDADGLVQFSFVSGALAASGIIEKCKIDVIILDHDLPEGNGSDLLNWMKEKNIKIPVITFSGIDYNNDHMMNLGASYKFNKAEVFNGLADNVLKQILVLHCGIAEDYVNKICINQPTAKRYWITPELMVGGSIIDAADYEHIKSKYYMHGVLNVETEHSDVDKGITDLCEIQVPDDGDPFPLEYVQRAAKFTDEFLTKNKGRKNLYVHCQMGGSRSPAFAYMVLRHHYKMSEANALGQVNGCVPGGNGWGWHDYHKRYLKSIEDGIKDLL